MAETALESRPCVEAKRPADRLQQYLGIVSTSLGIVGAVGTCFVFLAAQFYVGELEVKPGGPAADLTVKIYNEKGQESVFHTPRVQLMPGLYHVEVACGGKTQAAEATVEFGKVTVVPVSVGSAPDGAGQRKPAKKRRWWQLWRR